MKIFKECSIVFSIAIVSNIISNSLSLVIPGNVLGIFILFILLYFGIIKERQIETVSDFFLKNMPFFFVPGTIAIIEDYKFLEGKALIFIFICILLVVVVILSTGITAQMLENKRSSVTKNDE